MTYYSYVLFYSIIIPLIFSFHKKVEFYKKFYFLLKSIPIASLPFIIWDIIFVKMGIWGFDKNFIYNVSIYGLPIEEILFFFIIPFCCLFTYHLIELYKITFFKSIDWIKIKIQLSVILFIISILYSSNYYTFFCSLSAILIIWSEKFLKVDINYNFFITTFIIITIPFVIVNGALTGLFYNQTIVWYNPSHIIGIYLFTIPIEDIIYSFQLNLLNLMIFKKFNCLDN